MERTAVNPVAWSSEMGFNQGEVVAGESRTLDVSGQTAMSPHGVPQHEGDMAAQLALAVENLESVLAGAGMTLNGTPTLVSRAQYSAHSILFLSSTEAVVVGDLGAA